MEALYITALWEKGVATSLCDELLKMCNMLFPLPVVLVKERDAEC